MLSEKLLKDISFIVELDKMKTVLRQTSLIGIDRRENDAEHSWHISVMAMVLGEYSNEKVDICKVIKMLLVHDLVEIYAGDTFCYDEEGNKDKLERELLAADKIFGILEEDKGQELRVLWDEFEDQKTPESLFAASMDRIQPMISNYYNDGGTWKKFNIKKEDVYKRLGPVRQASDQLWDFVQFMVENGIKE